MSNEIPTIIKLNNLREAMDSYKGKINAVELCSHDWFELKSHEDFIDFFDLTTDVMGNQYINGVIITHSPILPLGSFYFKTKFL